MHARLRRVLPRPTLLLLLPLLAVAWLAAAPPARADAEDAIPLVEELIAGAESLALPAAVEGALVRPLERVLASLERGKEKLALVHLRVFEFFARLLLALGLIDEELAEGALEAAHVIRVAIAPGPPPLLKNLAVAFAPWDPVTDLAGDFVFVAAEEKVFLEFGAVVNSPDGPKTLPTFEYRVAPDAVVVSPIDGTVEAIAFKPDTNDYEIRLLASPLSPFLVVVDHVTDLLVAEGDAVAAGQALGLPGTFSATLGRTELQLVNFVERRSYCPLLLADPALAADLHADVSGLMDDWETFQGDAALYDQAAMLLPGCLNDSLAE
jgi:hypothetical protein